MHLTNFAVNSGPNHHIQRLENGQTSKWALSELFAYLEKHPPHGFSGVSARETAIHQIRTALQKTFIALADEIAARATPTEAHAFGLYGADVLLDENLHAQVLEINLQPALGARDELDRRVKGPLVRDLFDLARIQIFDQKTLKEHLNKQRNQTEATDKI